jgi:hypothetical protein
VLAAVAVGLLSCACLGDSHAARPATEQQGADTTRLTITVTTTMATGTFRRTSRLDCTPVGGTVPSAREACNRIAQNPEAFFGVPLATYADAGAGGSVHIAGRYHGAPVFRTYDTGATPQGTSWIHLIDAG